MAGKKEVSAVVVKAFQSCFQLFSVPDGEFGQNCGVLELEWDQFVAGPGSCTNSYDLDPCIGTLALASPEKTVGENPPLQIGA